MTRTAFLDEAVITTEGGNGGNGSTSFLRTRRQPRGGPDGGNGGRGGHVYAQANLGVNSLYDFVSKKVALKAASGLSGSGKRCQGASGKDLVLQVPVGTDIFDNDTDALHVSLLKEGQKVLLCSGGNGGRGNTTFKSSTNQAPQTSNPGGAGDERNFRLSLRLLADIGLLGLPNAGKSTFLNCVTRAKIKTGDYKFTTLRPQLGVVDLDDYTQMTIADLPGIISGAAEGIGLGVRFLRHATRTSVLLHLIDSSGGDVVSITKQHDEIINEIKKTDDKTFAMKPRVVVLTKIDLLDKPNLKKLCNDVKKKLGGIDVEAISSISDMGIDEIIKKLAPIAQSQQA